MAEINRSVREILNARYGQNLPVPENIAAAADTASGSTESYYRNRVIDAVGDDAPEWFKKQVERAETDVPTVEFIEGVLGIKGDPQNMPDGRTAEQKFIEDFPKKSAEWKKKVVENPALGERGWNTIKKVWQSATIDKMNEDIKAKRILALNGMDENGEVKNPLQYAWAKDSKFFTPRQYEAYMEGRDPSAKDYIGDALETGLMGVPGARYMQGISKVIGYAPKVGGWLSKKTSNKVISNILGNAVAPFSGEAVDAVMRGEEDPNVDRQEYSVGDALMGTATNLGVNYSLARILGNAARVGSGELNRSTGGNGSAQSRVRQMLAGLGEQGFGTSRVQRGLPAPTTKMGKILDIAEQAAPTVFVNRYGSDRDAKIGAAIAAAGLPGVDPSKALENIREDEKKGFKKERIGKQIDAIKVSEDLNGRDKEYLEAIKKNPDIVKFGYAKDPDDFNLWLIEKGHRLLSGTEASRPIWEIGGGKN